MHMPSGMRNWLYAMFPMAGAPNAELQLFFDFEQANEAMGPNDLYLWNLTIGDSRVQTYSGAALAAINEGLVSPEEPRGLMPNRSAILASGSPTKASCFAASRSNVRQRIHFGLPPLPSHN